MVEKKVFGAPVGVKVGDLFIDRKDLRNALVHAPLQAGISGEGTQGADSIVISGGYSDDEDHGDYIVYTGQGGRLQGSNVHSSDQILTKGNAGLQTSRMQGLPVRVVRGSSSNSIHAPAAGYRYDGLFLVTDSWMAIGRDGFLVIQFHLERLPDQLASVTGEPSVVDPAFATTTISRRIRDTAMSRALKQLYEFQCQVCGAAVPTFDGRPYAEGAHVRPLGRPHLGVDAKENILCLCPNHHVELDLGGMVILDDMSVATTTTLNPFAELRWKSGHRISQANASYQRGLWLPAA
jgi:putative restriction endonuclease